MNRLLTAFCVLALSLSAADVQAANAHPRSPSNTQRSAPDGWEGDISWWVVDAIRAFIEEHLNQGGLR